MVKSTFLSPTQTTIAGVFVTPEMHQIRSTHPIYWSIKNKLQNSKAETSPNNIFPRQIKRLSSSAHWSQTDCCFKESECIKCDSSMIADTLEVTKCLPFDAEGFGSKLPNPILWLPSCTGNLRLSSTSAFTIEESSDAFQTLVSLELIASLFCAVLE